MIEERQGNLLAQKSGYIVHGCNAQGVMGSGVAALIKYNYPEAYAAYKNLEFDYHDNNKKFPTGINIIHKHDEELMIVNAITQEFFGRDSNVVYVDYKAVNKCFLHLNNFIMTTNYTHKKIVHFPLIGCGLANGEWKVVSEIIDRALDNSIKKVLWTL